ncbi:hypothetical protein HDV06_002148 [Boothiomyces sp. JEL0866]|nr:hypothetical protein HDV06_002148 [Boothiomyces sp. JEL0866]
MEASIIYSAILSGIFSGLVAALISIGIEKFGGRVGGVLGSSPTTLIPASIGLFTTIASSMNLQSVVNYQKSMLVVCPAMIINCLFLYCWKYFPNVYQRWTHNIYALIILISLTSYLVWFILATCLVFLTRSISAENVQGDLSFTYIITDGSINASFYLAIGAMIVQLIVGVVGSWNYKKTPKSTSKVPWWSNILRGFAAGLAIFAAILLGHISPIIGGITSLFPAIFGTAMISVWLTSGSAVSMGAIEPMILGSLSVSFFAFEFAFILPLFNSWMHTGLAITLATILCYVISVTFFSFPILKFLEWRTHSNSEGEEVDLDQVSVDKLDEEKSVRE